MLFMNLKNFLSYKESCPNCNGNLQFTISNLFKDNSSYVLAHKDNGKYGFLYSISKTPFNNKNIHPRFYNSKLSITLDENNNSFEMSFFDQKDKAIEYPLSNNDKKIYKSFIQKNLSSPMLFHSCKECNYKHYSLINLKFWNIISNWDFDKKIKLSLYDFEYIISWFIIKRDNNLISIRNYDYLNNFENQTVVSITGKPSSDEDTFIIPFCNDLKKILSKVENLIPFT